MLGNNEFKINSIWSLPSGRTNIDNHNLLFSTYVRGKLSNYLPESEKNKFLSNKTEAEIISFQCSSEVPRVAKKKRVCNFWVQLRPKKGPETRWEVVECIVHHTCCNTTEDHHHQKAQNCGSAGVIRVTTADDIKVAAVEDEEDSAPVQVITDDMGKIYEMYRARKARKKNHSIKTILAGFGDTELLSALPVTGSKPGRKERKAAVLTQVSEQVLHYKLSQSQAARYDMMILFYIYILYCCD